MVLSDFYTAAGCDKTIVALLKWKNPLLDGQIEPRFFIFFFDIS